MVRENCFKQWSYEKKTKKKRKEGGKRHVRYTKIKLKCWETVKDGWDGLFLHVGYNYIYMNKLHDYYIYCVGNIMYFCQHCLDNVVQIDVANQDYPCTYGGT